MASYLTLMGHADTFCLNKTMVNLIVPLDLSMKTGLCMNLRYYRSLTTLLSIPHNLLIETLK